MKVFIGKEPENPCEKCLRNDCPGDCAAYQRYLCQQSILNQCREINKDWRPEDFEVIKQNILGCKFCDKAKVACSPCQCNIGFEAAWPVCLEALGRVK